ncbi:DUF805 domain-containing protein [Defluviimonas salinarum]|uniref:DUF805 domain-containing protein n=1 Tax=Defluviimonas salinarum TaxID=2992147 RepID=A0ABT3J895_9RHOB|nr:DUF805 domain-containing protein [Defluviimonas salinarum]MCW3783919.1 DUF805 domain-containing protein [Defluviimonas salinarum]
MSKPVFKDLLRLSGRRNRKSFLLAHLAISLGGGIAATVAMHLAVSIETAGGKPISGDVVGPAMIAIFLVAAPLVAVNTVILAQRIRDIGYSGWFALAGLAPWVSIPVYLLALVLPGTRGANRYGPDPLGRPAAGAAPQPA